MVNTQYIVARLFRRILPNALVQYLLRRNIGIQAGLETNEPQRAVLQYMHYLEMHSRSLFDQTVLNFGYGGRFGVALDLLQRGARHIYLYDKFASLDHRYNQRYLAAHPSLLRQNNDEVIPLSEYVTIIGEAFDEYVYRHVRFAVDVILSNSVLEHVRNPEETIKLLHRIAAPGCLQVHIIDLRDHFFRYPFEMLCYTEEAWKRWLNASNNLNRTRFHQYETIFRKYFRKVSFDIIASDIGAFKKVRTRIKPEFLSGNDEIDAVTQVAFIVELPRKKSDIIE